MARVFVSYASEDVGLAGGVTRWLVDGGHEVFLDRDARDGIAVGDRWEQRLYERLRWADAVVCVVTSAYVASVWCTAEVARAQAAGSRLLPVLAEAGVVHPLLGSVQHVDTTQDVDSARVRLCEALRRVDVGGGSGWPDGWSPFPGLRPFDTDEHRVFFGRRREVDQLATLLRSPAERAEGAVVLVVGPSGCGKSSLVRAGLVPVMVAEPGWWAVRAMVPGKDPVAALTRELAAAARQVGVDWTVADVRDRLEDPAGLAGLAADLLLAVPGGRHRHLLVVVDQFEELLTQSSPEGRARFAQLLHPALGGPVQVVATLRPEFLDELLLSSELAALPTHTYTVRPLHREGLSAVIKEPARLAGLGVDDDLVARLVADTDSGEALPLLAYTLAQLADGTKRGGELLTSRYEQLGGVQGTLTRQADVALAEAMAGGGRSRDQVIGSLLGLVTVDEQGRPSRWRVRRDELSESAVAEVDRFVARRLVSTDLENGDVVVGVAHEAFLVAWAPLAEAIRASSAALRARRGVEQAAAGWVEGARPVSRLWERGQLAAAVADTGARVQTVCVAEAASVAQAGSSPGQRRLPRWRRRCRVLVTNRVELSARARDFLLTSIRRDRYRRGRTTAILSVLLVLALAAAGVAVGLQSVAEDRQRLAIARQLIAQADAAARDGDDRTALQLGTAAHDIHPGPETLSSLVALLTTTRLANTLTGHTGPVSSMVFAPDGRTLATADRGGTVLLWDLTDRAQPRSLGAPPTGHTGSVSSMVFAPDSRTLVSTGVNGTVLLWDLTDRAQPRSLSAPLTDHTDNDSLAFVALAPDSHTLATADGDGTVLLWDLTDRAQPRRLGAPLTGHTNPVTVVVFAPDGRTLVTADHDGTVLLWDLADRAQPRRLGAPLTGHTNPVTVVAFAPDSRTLATSDGFGGTVLLWDLADRTQPRRLGTPLPAQANSVAFAPDGRSLAIADDGGTVLLWDLADRAQPRRLGAPLTGHTSPVTVVVFAPDGRTLATADGDGTVLLWDLADRAQPRRLGAPLTGHTSLVFSVEFAPDGRTLATADSDGMVLLWDLADRAQPRRLGAPVTSRTGPVFALDSRTLASTGFGGTVMLWDLTDRAQPRRLGAPLSAQATSVAFAPDGRTLASTGVNDTVSLWDLTDRAQPRRLGTPLPGQADSVEFAPDGRTLATASGDGTVSLWDLTDRAQPRRLGTPLDSNTGSVTSVAGSSLTSVVFAGDTRTLATNAVDGTVLLWDLADRAQPRRLGTPLTGLTGPVMVVAFAPDSRTLATADEGGTVSLWDLTDRAQPRRLGAPLTGNTGPVLSVAFTPDSHTLATADNNATTLWDLNGLNYIREHAEERACSILGHGLSPDEWDLYIQGLEYKDSCAG